MIKWIEGGITAAEGFLAAGVACGIKPTALDLALVVSEKPASAAGVFTTNLSRAAPVIVSTEHLIRSKGIGFAVVTSSGCANACTGEAGMTVAKDMAAETARLMQCPVEQVLVASTGVVGVLPDITKVKTGIAAAKHSLSRKGHQAAAQAIMTTDPWPKEISARASLPGGTFHIGGMVKGAGMIEPNLATMLAFITTDVLIEPKLLRRALVEATENTFNSITVDGECSTNDSVFALAGGASGVVIDASLFQDFTNALHHVCLRLALGIVRGGEGATKLIAIKTIGALSVKEAKRAGRAIANSPLVKTAIHGGDPNWGRLMVVAGRAGVTFDPSKASIKIGSTVLFDTQRAFAEREPLAAKHLQGSEIEIEVDLGTGGKYSATIWTCDLSAEYVRINADYRT